MNTNHQERNEYLREWRKNNPDSVKKHDKKSYEKRKEKSCAYAAKWRKENPEAAKDKQLRQKFGITLEDYNRMLQEQEGKCKICKTDRCNSGRAFAVDHCHETKVVRGLLCWNCNLLLGRAKDNPDLLRQAANYLEIS